MRALELKIPPPLVAIIIGGAMWAAAHALPAILVPSDLRAAIAGLCAVFGMTVAVLGVFAFRQARTTLNPFTPDGASSVVTGGIFHYTRNPMYLGLAAGLLGWTVWLSIPWLVLGPVALIAYLTRFQIVPEERIMSSKFGRDYDEYRRHVRRWL